MIITEVTEILRMLVDKNPSEMTRDELLKHYEDLLNTYIGTLIGSAITTSQIKELLEKHLPKKDGHK